MRLHRLRLSHVKGVTDLSVDFPDTGVVVVEGPNEVGKSTLLEALDRLLDPSCKATSKATGVKALQPVGVEEGPCVEAELSLGGYRLVFTKRWLLRPTTTLRVLQPSAEQLAGEAAQARMTAILAECLDRPLFDALRYTQAGEPQIPLTSSRLLAEALDGAAGADLHTDSGADLLGEVEAEFLRYFTRTGRPTGDYRTAIAETEVARDAVVHAHTQVGEAQDLLEQREAAILALRSAQAVTPEVESTLDRARAQAVAATAVVQELRTAQERAEAAQAAHARARGDHDLRQRMVRELQEHGEGVAALSEDVARGVAGEQLLVAAQTTAQEAVHASTEALARARDVAELAGADADHLGEVAEVARLRDRLQRSEQLSAQLAAAQAVLEESTVTPAVLRRLTDASGAVDVAQATIEGAATVLSLQGLGDAVCVEVDGAPLRLAADGDAHERLVSQETSLVLPGKLRLTVRPQGDVVTLPQQLEWAQGALTKALAQAEVADLAAARERCTAHETATAEAHRLQTELAGVCGGESTAALTARVDELQTSTDGYLTGRSGVDALPATVAQAKAVQQAAKDEVTQHVAVLARARAGAEEARQACVEARSGREVAGARLEQVMDMLQVQQRRLAEARQECDDDAVEEAEQAAATAASQTQEGLAAAQQAVADADATGAQARLVAATEAVGAHRDRVSSLRDRAHHLKGSVELCAGEGRQEAHDLALQGFEEARAALRSIERRARAARQLHQTLQRHREQAHDAYVAPFAAAVERLGTQVYGDTFGVVVSRDLVLTHRHLHGRTVPFESLSGGAKEQLGILARLAVASLVDADQGVPVVIDDALGYTDPARLRSVGRVLADPGSTGQVILLTCNPERYAAMEGATTISLTA